MLGGLRTERVGNEVKVYDGDYFLWKVYPFPSSSARRYRSVAAMVSNWGGGWPLDHDGTRLKPNPEIGPTFRGYVPAGPVGEFGWLLDLVQEAGLVLPEPATHPETTP